MGEQSILIIEDDVAIREGVRILLGGEGYEVEEAGNGRDGLKKVTDRTDLVILDVMMPGISGIQTCEEIRKISNVPVLFLTAKSQESDKLLGLMVGGDDYLVKPFSYAELLGRVKAILRRRNVYDREKSEHVAAKQEWLETSGIRLNSGRNQAFCRGEELALTDKEYHLLALFMEYPKKVFSVSNLYESVWGESFDYTSGNTVMVYIRKLRKKMRKIRRNRS